MTEDPNKALRSFFGAREGGQNRPQSVNTPLFLLTAIKIVWPGGIELDPCSNDTSIVEARTRCYEYGTDNGLHVDWPDYTYANPPYDNLKAWIRKPRRGLEHMLLGPVRTNRTWFCDAVGKATRICWLKPFAFLGHQQVFPGPLGMFYWGSRYSEFDAAFEPYGSLGVFTVFDNHYKQTELFAS